MADLTTHQGHLDARGKKFALVASRFNELVCNRLIAGAKDCLVRHGAAAGDIELFRTPGSFELPLVAKKVAQSGVFHAVVCLGAIIRSETPHFDFVANETAKGIGQVTLDTEVPVVFGVITTDNLEQAIDRAGARSGNRGADAALTAIEMANLLEGMARS